MKFARANRMINRLSDRLFTYQRSEAQASRTPF